MTSDGLSFLAIESALEYVVQLLNDEDTDVRELAEFLFNALTSLHEAHPIDEKHQHRLQNNRLRRPTFVLRCIGPFSIR